MSSLQERRDTPWPSAIRRARILCRFVSSVKLEKRVNGFPTRAFLCHLVNCSLESASPTGPPSDRGPLDMDLGQSVKQEMLG